MSEALAQMGFVHAGGIWTLTRGEKVLTVIPESRTVVISYIEPFAYVDIRYSGVADEDSMVAIISEALNYPEIVQSRTT